MLTRALTPLRTGLFVLAMALCTSAAFGQVQQPQPDTSQLLSESDVSQEQIQKAARVAVAVQMATRADRMKMRKELQQKYGNPQQMDSTQKAQARREMRQRQMKMQKKQMKLMQKEAKKASLDPKFFQRLMRSAQKDSTLRTQVRTAMKAEMKKRQSQMNQNPNQQNQ